MFKFGILILCLLILGAVIYQQQITSLYLMLTASPYERSLEGAPKILVLGDSTGYGTGASKPEDSIAGLIARDFPGYSIENNSVNGRTIGELVEVAREVEGQYLLILLQIGGNDILQQRSVGDVERELRVLVQELNSHTDNLVMMSSGNVGGAAAFSGEEADQYTALTREFRQMFLRVSGETELRYVDLFLEPENDVISNNPDTYLAADGLHPSSAGYALWYESLQPVIRPLLAEQ
jgi:lysophospholipase L1-like esterase